MMALRGAHVRNASGMRDTERAVTPHARRSLVARYTVCAGKVRRGNGGRTLHLVLLLERERLGGGELTQLGVCHPLVVLLRGGAGWLFARPCAPQRKS